MLSSIADTIEPGIDFTDVGYSFWFARIAYMASLLLVYETYLCRLGLGDVVITRLPNSYRLEVYWNEEPEKLPILVYTVVNKMSTIGERERSIAGLLIRHVVVEV